MGGAKMSALKKPKIEEGEEADGGVATAVGGENGVPESGSRDEREVALVALIEHRTKEVEHLCQRITYYKAQLDQAERRLEDSQSKLSRLRSHGSFMSSMNSQGYDAKDVKVELTSTGPVQISKDSSRNQSQSRPKLEIPALKPKVFQTVKTAGTGTKASSGSHIQAETSVSSQTNCVMKLKGKKSCGIYSELEAIETQTKGTKRNFEQKEYKDLIPLICSCSSPCTINCQMGCYIPSQHKRKLRSLVLCPTNDQLFVTSALDGVVNLWEVQDRGSTVNLLSSTDCMSSKQRRWPEDVAWHPDGNSLFSVYSADGVDSQISVLNLNKTKREMHKQFLEEKPHVKGIINNIAFMPWENVCFVTGGSDHAVVIWTDGDGENPWKPKALHRSLHSSSVMGVAGMQQKQVLLSAGADKRIIGFDLSAGRVEYKHQLESKCMSVLPNPYDFNLFMVQTGTLERQLRLFDIRSGYVEIQAFGWKQESSDSQSALISQAWSPDGLYISSGSVDPVIHIFDIRYNAREPSQSVRAHQRRVFKAEWHQSLRLLISISSDLNIGLHKFT